MEKTLVAWGDVRRQTDRFQGIQKY